MPTHCFSYYATRFLWPISEYRIDDIAWWTPWFWVATYGALGVVYLWLWKSGWIGSERHQEANLAEAGRDTSR